MTGMGCDTRDASLISFKIKFGWLFVCLLSFTFVSSRLRGAVCWHDLWYPVSDSSVLVRKKG